jgi:hypothetical protein
MQKDSMITIKGRLVVSLMKSSKKWILEVTLIKSLCRQENLLNLVQGNLKFLKFLLKNLQAIALEATLLQIKV